MDGLQLISGGSYAMDAQKLAKVLALAASDNESEALHALRTARRLLEAQGADFVELARRCALPQAPAQAGSTQAHMEDLEDAIFDLRNEIRHLRSENERLRQGRPAPTGAAAPPPPPGPSLAEAAENAAAAIRLRAELAQMRDQLDARDTELLRLRAQEAALSEQFKESLAEAGRLSARLGEVEGRKLRLEAENRRLATANSAMTAELAEIEAARRRMEAEVVAHETRAVLAGKKPKRRGKQPASQYALL